MNRSLSIIIFCLFVTFFPSCSVTRPPTSQELKVTADLQGKWEGIQYERGWWHVYGNPKTGATGASATLIFIGQKVKFLTVNTPNPFWQLEYQRPRIPIDSYIREYAVDTENEVVFPDSCFNHKMIFRFTGPDTLEGYRDDLPDLAWKFQRVASGGKAISQFPEEKEWHDTGSLQHDFDFSCPEERLYP
jgi:hypothetical protein